MVNTQIRSLTSANYYQMIESGNASIEIITPPRGQSLSGRESVSLPQFSEICLNIGDFFPAAKT
jgi:hypothetical protein